MLSKNVRVLGQICANQLRTTPQSGITPEMAHFSSKPEAHVRRAKPKPSCADADAQTSATTTRRDAEPIAHKGNPSSAQQVYMKGYQLQLLPPQQRQRRRAKYGFGLNQAKGVRELKTGKTSVDAVNGREATMISSPLKVLADWKKNLMETKVDSDTNAPVNKRINNEFHETARIMGNGKSIMYSIFQHTKPSTPKRAVNPKMSTHQGYKKHPNIKKPRLLSTLYVKSRPYPKMHAPIPSYSEHVKTKTAPPLLEPINYLQSRYPQPKERLLSDKPRLRNTKDIDMLLTSAKRPLPQLPLRRSRTKSISSPTYHQPFTWIKATTDDTPEDDQSARASEHQERRRSRV